MLVAIVALFLIGWLASHKNELDDAPQYSITTNSGSWLVSAGSKGNRLMYAVFEGVKVDGGDIVSGVCVSTSSSSYSVLTKPDGATISLTGKKQLVEIIDGRFRDSDERVALNQFNAFMNSNPDEYTIERLVEFARLHK